MKWLKRNRMTVWATGVALAGMSMGNTARAESASFGFEGDTVGATPGGWFVTGNNFNYVTNSNAYAGDNAAFFTLYNGGLGYNFTNAVLNDLSSGSVDFQVKFNQAAIDNSWNVQLRDGTNGTGNGGAVALIYPGNANFMGSYNYGNSIFNSGAPATTGVYHHLRIEWDVHGATDYLRWIWDGSVTNYSSTAGPNLVGVRSVWFLMGGASPSGVNLFLDEVTFTAVPEPASAALVAAALIGVAWRRRRR